MLLPVWGTCNSWACSFRRDTVESMTGTHTMPHLPTKVRFSIIEHQQRWIFIWCRALAIEGKTVGTCLKHFEWQKKKNSFRQTMNTVVRVICDLKFSGKYGDTATGIKWTLLIMGWCSNMQTISVFGLYLCYFLYSCTHYAHSTWCSYLKIYQRYAVLDRCLRYKSWFILHFKL